MRRHVVVFLLGATVSRGYVLPRATSRRPIWSPLLDHTSDYRTKSRSRRPSTSMMAGPNKGKRPGFFDDWPKLEAELKAYLAEREAGEPIRARVLGSEKYSLPAFLSTSTSKTLEELEFEGEPSVLAYSELSRYGYTYLIEPIVKLGGYSVAAERLGITMAPRSRKQRPKLPPIELEDADGDGFLALGRAREERMESGLEMDRMQRRSSVFEKQAEMARNSEVILKSSKTQVSVDVSRPPGLPEEMVEPINRVWVPSKEDSASIESWALSLPQRVYAVAVAGCCAIAFGRGTAQAIELGVLPSDITDVAGPASALVLALNAGSAVLGGTLATRKGRSVPLWVLKGALAGLVGVLELRMLPNIGEVPEVLSKQEQGSA